MLRCILLGVSITVGSLIYYMLCQNEAEFYKGDLEMAENAWRAKMYSRTNYKVLALSSGTMFNGTDDDGAQNSQKSSFFLNNTEITSPSFLADVNCDTVHIAFVVEDFPSCTAMTRALKSLLFHRKSPVKLHLVLTSKELEETVRTLFDTWIIQFFEYAIYNHDLAPAQSGRSFSDLSIFPGSLRKVILLHVNLTINSDITGLWKYFNNMLNEGVLVGAFMSTTMVRSRAGNLCYTNGSDYDTTVLLLDLQGIRKNPKTEKLLLLDNRTQHLGLKELLIVAIGLRLHYYLPCRWNPAVSYCSNYRELCETHTNDISIVHSDGKGSLNMSDNLLSHLILLEQHSMQLESRLLESIPLRCKKKEKSRLRLVKIPQYMEKIATCQDVFKNAQNVYRTHKYFIGTKYSTSDPYDVTLVTQMTMDRFSVFVTLVEHWKGPISVVVYCTDYEAWQLMEYFKHNKVLRSRKDIAVHAVFKRGDMLPVNYIRNVAMIASTTPYVFLSDCDFLPSYNLYTYLKKSAKVLITNTTSKRALIVPAFESLHYNFQFPPSKMELLQQCKKKKLQIFHQEWYYGHGPTNYNKWASTRHPYTVNWVIGFEPYIMIDRNAPRYSEQFFGYGWNKISHIMEVKAQGYSFVVLPNAYIIHCPHMKTADRTDFVNNKHTRSCVDELKNRFIRDMYNRYGKDSLKNKEMTKTIEDVIL